MTDSQGVGAGLGRDAGNAITARPAVLPSRASPAPTCDSTHPLQQTLTLANGLRVQLHHHPHLKQAAAWLRVDAGSHDVPPAWPGLAHFLEHLLFLGTDRYSGDQGLMAFVQRHGGQLNASTRERTTDFFFELPPPAFAEGLERLGDMLGQPRLGLAEQLREREVLHAEFIAWQRDRQARHEQWLTGPLNPAHPLRAFHAGNRYSLPVNRPAFQQALSHFYRSHYQTGQMTLCLTGPQPLAQLHSLALQASALLRPGAAMEQAPPPALLGQARGEPGPADCGRLNLVFACEGLPPGAALALEFLATWLASNHPGGLLAELRHRGWADSLQLKPHYRYAGQGLINLEVNLTGTGQDARAQIAELCFDWLQSFAAQDDWPTLREEFGLLRQRRQQVAGALELARQYIEQPDAELADSLPALRALLAQLQPAHVLHPLQTASRSTPLPSWRLPPRNRFLRPARRGAQPAARPTAITWLPGPASPQAAVLLRWRLANATDSGLGQALERALVGTVAEAAQAGVNVSFSQLGCDWTLRCIGVAGALAPVVEHCLATLRQPPVHVWRPSGSLPPVQIPIRELLKHLPHAILGQPAGRQAQAATGQAALARGWAAARWDGLAIGLSSAEQEALCSALSAMPGVPATDLNLPLAPCGRWLWHTLPTPSSEHALLLFCPVAGTSLADEATWRLLAHLVQGPFYQRLRVELQLGYAVFSDWRQVGGQGGLLFGVQSPGTAVAQLLGHLQTFLETLPARLAAIGSEALAAHAAELAARFTLDQVEPAKAAEWLWQARLAGHGAEYLPRLQQAFARIDMPTLQVAAQALRAGSGGRVVLATAACDDPRWQSPVESAHGSLPILQRAFMQI